MDFLKTPPPLIALLCLISGLAIDIVAPEGPPVSRIFQALGILPAGMGIRLIIWAVQTFERSDTSYKLEETPTVLITDGPMRISRHPMYLGMALALSGVGWLLVSTPVMLSGLAFALTIQKFFIPNEEKMLEHLFGNEYHDYRSHVRMWL